MVRLNPLATENNPSPLSSPFCKGRGKAILRQTITALSCRAQSRHLELFRLLNSERFLGFLWRPLAYPAVIDRRYSDQIVSPPAIVRTARPLSFQPPNGVLRDSDSNLDASTIHSRSGSINVMSAFVPIDRVPASILSNLAGSTVNISINRLIEIAFRLCTKISMNKPSSVSSPTIPNGA